MRRKFDRSAYTTKGWYVLTHLRAQFPDLSFVPDAGWFQIVVPQTYSYKEAMEARVAVTDTVHEIEQLWAAMQQNRVHTIFQVDDSPLYQCLVCYEEFFVDPVQWAYDPNPYKRELAICLGGVA